MTLTEEQIKKYLECPTECPYCGSTNITGDPVEVETEERDIQCLDCDKAWKEVWSVTDIREDEEEEDQGDEFDPHEHDLTVAERL